MAYTLIHTGSFEDNRGDRVDVHIYSNASSPPAFSPLILDGNPISIEYPTQEFDSQLFGCGARINVINDSSNFFRYDHLFSAPERSIKVEIIKTSPDLDSSIFLFQGYVLPQLYSSTLEKNIRVTIPATDQLKLLEKINPYLLIDTSSYRAEEIINAYDLIYNTIYDLDVVPELAINNSIYNINYEKTPTSTVFNNVFFDANNFADKEGLFDDKKILEMILKSFYSRMYYYNGRWYIDRIKDMATYDKNYAVFNDIEDVSTYSFIDSNARINLSDHNVIAQSANFSYEPGYQKVVLKLNYKQPESLLDNYYWDFQYFTQEVSLNIFPTPYPMPRHRKWMMSATDSSLLAETYVDVNIPQGLTFFLNIDWAPINNAKWDWLGNQFASSMFQFNPVSPDTVVSVKYDYSLDPASVGDSSIRGAFALRTVNSAGTNYWIAKSNKNDTSTYWSTTPYLFTKEDRMTNLTSNKLEMNSQINITRPLVTNPTYSRKVKRQPMIPWFLFGKRKEKWETFTYENPHASQLVHEMYLDIYGCRKSSGSLMLGMKTQFGNVDVDIAPTRYPDILEASLGNFLSIKNVDIDIFDASTILYTNNAFNFDGSLMMRTINKWRDSSTENWLTLQEQLLQDYAQVYGSPRYVLEVDVKSKDASMFSMGNIYTHTDIRDPINGKPLEFIATGMKFNVKDNAYRLTLHEHIADDNWRIKDPSTITPPPDPDPSVGPIEDSFYVDIDASGLFYRYNGDECTGMNGVDISTNVGWYITYDPDFFEISPESGFDSAYVFIGIRPEALTEIGWVGYITIIPEEGKGFDPFQVNITQLAEGVSCP